MELGRVFRFGLFPPSGLLDRGLQEAFGLPGGPTAMSLDLYVVLLTSSQSSGEANASSISRNVDIFGSLTSNLHIYLIFPSNPSRPDPR